MSGIDFTSALVHFRALETASLDLICCSPPPFDRPGLQIDGEARSSGDLIARFIPIARECARTLAPCGSLILELEAHWIPGRPARNPFPYELILCLGKPIAAGGEGWHLAQELYLFDPAHLTTPEAGLVAGGMRFADPMRTFWWFSRSPFPKADNRRVLKPYSQAQRALMLKGDAPHRRPSEHRLSGKFARDNGGAIPPNLIGAADTWINGPVVLPLGNDGGVGEAAEADVRFIEFVVRLCTEAGDRVCDPFDRTAGERRRVVEALGRCWVDIAMREEIP